MTARNITLAFAITILGAFGGCKKSEDPPIQEPAAPEAAITNRVDIPPPVRENLGITFAKVESRNVARTLRLPGKFELLPEGQREYRTMLPGSVEVLVSLNQHVEVGTPLYRLDSARWRELQQQLADAEAAMARARTNFDTIKPLKAALAVHGDSLREAVSQLEGRARQLERVRAEVGGKADELAVARTDLAKTKSDLGEVMEKDAELAAREKLALVEIDAASARFSLLMRTASMLCCPPLPAGLGKQASESRETPDWKSIAVLEARSATSGIVESVALSTGSWAEEAALVLRVVEPDRVHFRAKALQSRVARLAGVTEGRIVPPRGEGGEVAEGFAAAVTLGTALDSSSRSLDVFALAKEPARWARAGAAGFLEVVTGGSSSNELAIPLSSVTHDGATAVIFRRDPGNADKAIRLEADLGIDDGRWIVVKSAVAEGDEIVLHGAWQLMLATSGTAAKGGHFHADGTFHEGHK